LVVPSFASSPDADARCTMPCRLAVIAVVVAASLAVAAATLTLPRRHVNGADYLATPVGWMLASCVREVPNGMRRIAVDG
jgi:hypothetical protein